MDANDAPVNLLYAVLGAIVLGFGVVLIIIETGASRRALQTRWGFLFAGVVLFLLGGALLVSQVIALFT